MEGKSWRRLLPGSTIWEAKWPGTLPKKIGSTLSSRPNKTRSRDCDSRMSGRKSRVSSGTWPRSSKSARRRRAPTPTPSPPAARRALPRRRRCFMPSSATPCTNTSKSCTTARPGKLRTWWTRRTRKRRKRWRSRGFAPWRRGKPRRRRRSMRSARRGFSRCPRRLIPTLTLNRDPRRARRATMTTRRSYPGSTSAYEPSRRLQMR
mmetsp:Transcript_116/g.432  ORF Transcript_116/g.432 Transcript_116/m.432 type:complete len:206 (-) Transcript_116:735-1352(-)